jgi:hypothetical protein
LNRSLRIDVSGEGTCLCWAYDLEFLSGAASCTKQFGEDRERPPAVFFNALLEAGALDRMEQFAYYGAGYDRRDTKRFIDRAVSIAGVV